MTIETLIRGLPTAEGINGTSVKLLAPGYQGRVEQIDSTTAGARGGKGESLPLEQAANANGAVIVAEISVDLTPPLSSSDTGGRSGGEIQPRLFVPKHSAEELSVVLHTDEYGESSWLLPVFSDEEDNVFELPPPALPSSSQKDGARGDITRAMRALVRVVTWVAEPILKAGALAIASLWEKSKRPYGLRQVTAAGEFVVPNWSSLTTGGPVLLLVHGTFSTPEAGFHGWVGTDAFATVVQRYGNRCLALAHPSLSASPDDNVSWMVDQLAADFRSPVDVVCHSRGGLVTRAIASHGRLTVRRACQVGTPNLGTPLAHAKHWVTFLDSHTTLLTKLPDSVTTIVLESILCVLKIIATGAAKGLPGLAAMEPDGDYLGGLGHRKLAAQQWFTVGANYSPDAASGSRLTQRAADVLIDKFFAGTNDMVVPSDGCHLPGSTVTDSLRLSGASVHHCNYFEDRQVHERLNAWLQ